MVQYFYFVVSLATFAASRAIENQAVTCKDLYISTTVKTMNMNRSSSPSLNDSTTYRKNRGYSNAKSKVTNKTFHSYGRYCEPANDLIGRRDVLQVLVHGATYNVDYWSGLAPPGRRPGQNAYSWVSYASSRGYPTLSLDRLCNGKSSKPNGITICQSPLQAQIIHNIIQSARLGTLPRIKRRFNNVIYVGHSYGSVVGNVITQDYPTDIDVFIATGFSLVLSQADTGGPSPDYKPAQAVQPKRWGFLDEPGYLIATSEKGTRDLFYFGAFKESEAHYDYMHRRTVTQGELKTAVIGQHHAPDFRGSVFVLNGNNDVAFCSTPSGADGRSHGNCSDGISSEVGRGYPNARAFGYYNSANTGHCLNLHTTAQKSFKAAHDFLNSQGF